MGKRVVLSLSFFLPVVLGSLIFLGYIHPNALNIGTYPVRGLDVSAHQGRIAWDSVAKNGYDFVFIKATEGKDFIDRCFGRNWAEARRVGLKRGAYHFFTFRSSGTDQARHFIRVVPKEPDCLPPVIDLEFGGNSRQAPSREKLNGELTDFMRIIRAHYGVEPIIYVLHGSYEKLLTGGDRNNIIWISDILWRPRLRNDARWVFWQYSSRGRVKGIKGFVDLDVFRGSREQFERRY